MRNFHWNETGNAREFGPGTAVDPVIFSVADYYLTFKFKMPEFGSWRKGSIFNKL